MVMFFNWVDLWLAVTIILPFTLAEQEEPGWTAQAKGGWLREGNTRATENIEWVGHNDKVLSYGFRKKTNKKKKDR